MTRVSAAVVGAGLMGRWHARYAPRAGAELAAVVDVDREAAGKLSARFPRAEAFADLGECLTRSDIDAVHVCTGVESHAALAETALLAGKHVLLEKPAAGSPRELERLLDLASGRGLTLTATHQLPFQRGFRRLRQGLSRLGDLVEVRYRACSAGGDGLPETRRASILLEMLPHPVSLIRPLLGGEVGADRLRVLACTPDELEIFGTRQRTLLGISIGLRGRPTRHELVVTGTRGTAWLDLFHGTCVFEGGRVSRASKALRPFRQGALLVLSSAGNLVRRAALREPAFPGLSALIEGFYRAVRGEGAPPVTGEEMMESLALIEAVRGSRAAAGGQQG